MNKISESVFPDFSLPYNLEYVKEIEAGKRGSRLYGNVHRIEKESYNARGSFVPLADIEVSIKGKKINSRRKLMLMEDMSLRKFPQIFTALRQNYPKVCAKSSRGKI